MATTKSAPAKAAKATPAKATPESDARSEAGTANIEEAAKATTPAIDWDALPDAEEASYMRGPIRTDVEKDTPEVIKRGVWRSYEAYDKEKRQPFWLSQKLPNEEVAREFLRLLKRYGKSQTKMEERITVRATPLASDPTTIRFCAKPFEARDKQ